MVDDRTVAYGTVVAKKRRLTREDWTAAALEAVADGGVGAVAMEPLAGRLGTTKGSAYWHFANRDELLRATVERWEREATEAEIDLVEAEPDGLPRLDRLFTAVFEDIFAAAQVRRLELAMLAAATDPVVAPVLHRVTERRITYLAGLFAAIGFAETEARHRACLTYSSYLGNLHLLRDNGDLLPVAERRAYLDLSLRLLGSRVTESEHKPYHPQ